MNATKTICCPNCDGLGEWDEGPINCGGAAPVDPEYRQVICETCEGTGRIPPRQKPTTPYRDLDDEIAF